MNLVTIATLLAALLVLLVLSALFSGGETALFSITSADRARLRRLSPAAAAAAQALLAKPRRLLILILLLNVSANSAFFVVSSLLAAHAPGHVLPAVLAVGSVMTMVLFGEVVPKSLATAHRVRFGRFVAPLLRTIGRVLDPVGAAFEAAILRPLSRLFRPAGAGEARAITTLELSSLLEAGAGRGVIDEDEQQLLSDVVALGTVRVREVMTPRVDLRWLPASAGAEQLAELVRSTGHTKYPVARASLDAGVLGIVNAKRFLAAHAAGALGARTTPAQWAQPAVFVPDRARLDQLLDLFRARHAHVALCVDELGALTGLVEVEDVVRQLVRPVAEPGDSDSLRVTAVGRGSGASRGAWASASGRSSSGPTGPRPATGASTPSPGSSSRPSGACRAWAIRCAWATSASESSP